MSRILTKLSASIAILISTLFLSFSAKAFDNDVEFLKVDEAFQLSYYLDGNELVLDWMIASNYYLYRDRTLFSSNSGSLSSPVFSDNVIDKYDPNFDEVMALFYDVMVARVKLDPQVNDYEINFEYQGCADEGLCYPPQKKQLLVSLTDSNVELSGPAPRAAVSSNDFASLDFTEAPVQQTQALNLTQLIFAMGAAFLGGLILNLMPCVFPVLSIKALQITQMSEDLAKARVHGWVYTLGVVASFMAVAGALILLRQFGDWVGWGFQLQNPYFVAFLVLLFTLVALNMAGYFEFGQSFMGVGQGLTQKDGHSGSFFTGVLAVLVATPCTAPFMGSAIGFALAQPAYVSLLIFAVMGLGLAFPVLLISLIPMVSKALPKPGPWMENFKQILAFPLFATALWLLWVLVEIKGTDALVSVGGGLILLTFALWQGLAVKSGHKPAFNWFKRGVKYLSILVAFVLVMDQRDQVDPWTAYTPDTLAKLQQTGKPIFVDVTAAWCITCKANKRVALSGEDFHSMVKEKDVQLVQADWTNPSPAVDSLIAEYGFNGVPMYLYFEPGAAVAKVLPQILTPALIEETFASIP